MIELIISHNGKNWTAKNDLLFAEAPTLEKLDSDLERQLKQKGFLEKAEEVDLFMSFDNSIIPQWIRQYSQHYFNRIIRLRD